MHGATIKMILLSLKTIAGGAGVPQSVWQQGCCGLDGLGFICR